MHTEFDRAGNHDDENEDLEGVDQRRNENALVLVTAAVAVRTEIVYGHVTAAVADEGEDSVREEADAERTGDLDADDLRKERNGNALGQEHGNQLVGRREENGKQRPGRDHPARIERGGRRRDAALRNRAGKRTGGRSDRTSTLEKLLERATCVGFNRLQDEIRRKEERKKQQGFLDEFDQAWAIASFGH